MNIVNHLYPAIALIVALLITYVAMPQLLRFCLRRGLYDMPNERKVHHNRTPRLGGTLFVPAAMAGMVVSLMVMQALGDKGLVFKFSTFLIIFGIFLIYLIGLLDDILGLRASLKFLIQFIAALFMPLCGLYLNNLYGLFGVYEIPLSVGYPLTIFISLLIVNAINLIDGIDGLAAGISLIILAAFYVLYSRLGVMSYLVFIVALSGSVIVFMYFNLWGSNERNTKTFMGDTGSLILGYSIAFLAIKYMMQNEGVLPNHSDAFLMSYSLVLVPVFDLIRVALARLRRGVSIFHPDKTHLHHLCMSAGCSMHAGLLVILSVQLSFFLANVLMFYVWSVDITWIVAIDVVVAYLLYSFLIYQVKAHSK